MVLNLGSSNKTKEYLSKVCDQIRWKKSHEIISEEMENHIIDQTNTFISQGLDEEVARDKAILEMGDPISVGTELDSIYRPRPEWSIIILTGMLLVLGIIIRGFIIQDSQIPISLTREIVYSIIGIGIMGFAYFLDFTILGEYPRIIYFSLVLITIGSLVISPRLLGQSYYAKYMMLFFPTAFSGIIYEMRTKGYKGIIICGLYFLIPAILCLIIPSLSNLILYVAICLFLLTFAILKGWFNVKRLKAVILVYVPTSIFLLATVLSMKEYQIERIKYAINPYLDPHGNGYILVTLRNLLANSKIIGRNLSSSNIKEVLPAINTDFVVTNLIYSFGWLAFIGLIALVLLFIVKSTKVSLSQKGLLGRLVSMSVIASFSFQSIFYLINNLGLIYVDPIGFPLISNGKTSLMINMFLIGIMLSVYKSKALSSNEEKIIKKSRKNRYSQFLYFLGEKR